MRSVKQYGINYVFNSLDNSSFLEKKNTPSTIIKRAFIKNVIKLIVSRKETIKVRLHDSVAFKKAYAFEHP